MMTFTVKITCVFFVIFRTKREHWRWFCHSWSSWKIFHYTAVEMWEFRKGHECFSIKNWRDYHEWFQWRRKPTMVLGWSSPRYFEKQKVSWQGTKYFSHYCLHFFDSKYLHIWNLLGFGLSLDGLQKMVIRKSIPVQFQRWIQSKMENRRKSNNLQRFSNVNAKWLKAWGWLYEGWS